MENKRNEATINRPKGDRVIDAHYVFIDMPDFINQLRTEDAWQKNDRNGITVFKTGRVTMVLTCLHAKAILKDILVDGIFSIQVIEGAARIKTIDGDVEMEPGQIIAFHQLVDHSIEAKTDCVLLLTNNAAEINEKKDMII